MKSNKKSRSRLLVGPSIPIFSARGFALRAVELLVLFCLLHALGIRRYTGILCGTFAAGKAGAFAGLFYVLLYLASIVLAPILLIAAALWGLYNRLRRSRGGGIRLAAP